MMLDAVMLARRAKAMRDAQKAYFKARRSNPHTPCTDELNLSRRLEAELDQEIEVLLAVDEETPSLFGDES
jgi:transposase